MFWYHAKTKQYHYGVRQRSKAPLATLTLSLLQQQAQVTSHFVIEW
jgi:hypothetical protein